SPRAVVAHAPGWPRGPAIRGYPEPAGVEREPVSSRGREHLLADLPELQGSVVSGLRERQTVADLEYRHDFRGVWRALPEPDRALPHAAEGPGPVDGPAHPLAAG